MVQGYFDRTIVGPVQVEIVGENQNKLTWSFHIPGSLAANVNVRWTVKHNVLVNHISVVSSNDSDATVIFGVSTDTDSVLTSSVVGDSNVPAEYEPENKMLMEGDIAVLTVDYDGAGGTPASDLTVVITATEQ